MHIHWKWILRNYIIFVFFYVFFIYWLHNMIFPFWKMVLVDAFIIWYSLNELINTSLYFFTGFVKTDLFWFLLLWVFELMKALIINNIEVPCYNMTKMTTCKAIVIFITATFDWIRVLRELINIWMMYKLFTVKKLWSNRGTEIINDHDFLLKVKLHLY